MNIDLLLHSKGKSIRLPSFLYDHGHVGTETNPSDETVVAALEERNLNQNIRKEHRDFISSSNTKENCRRLKEAQDQQLVTKAQGLAMQGEWTKLFDLQGKDSSFQAITKGLPESIYRWHIRASNNSLPTASYLSKIDPRISPKCEKCDKTPQTLHHILNFCSHSLESGLYTWRHNNVLKELKESLQTELSESWEIRADLGNLKGTQCNTIPLDVLPTTSRPDICLINRNTKEISLLELTICWDLSHGESEKRKEEKYAPLVAELVENGWKVLL